jgi:hypothetical protein
MVFDSIENIDVEMVLSPSFPPPNWQTASNAKNSPNPKKV